MPLFAISRGEGLAHRIFLAQLRKHRAAEPTSRSHFPSRTCSSELGSAPLDEFRDRLFLAPSQFKNPLANPDEAPTTPRKKLSNARRPEKAQEKEEKNQQKKKRRRRKKKKRRKCQAPTAPRS
jgi:hypothetical protein